MPIAQESEPARPPLWLGPVRMLNEHIIAEARFEVVGPGNELCPECANREPMSTPKIEGSSGLMLDAGDGGKSELYKQMKKDPDNGEWVLFVDV
jgi:hypothetical protein